MKFKKTILSVELKQLESLEDAIDEPTRKIAVEAAEEPRVRLLMGFTGIDYYSAMLLLAEIGDVRRFNGGPGGIHATRGEFSRYGNFPSLHLLA